MVERHDLVIVAVQQHAGRVQRLLYRIRLSIKLWPIFQGYADKIGPRSLTAVGSSAVSLYVHDCRQPDDCFYRGQVCTGHQRQVTACGVACYGDP